MTIKSNGVDRGDSDPLIADDPIRTSLFFRRLQHVAHEASGYAHVEVSPSTFADAETHVAQAFFDYQRVATAQLVVGD